MKKKAREKRVIESNGLFSLQDVIDFCDEHGIKKEDYSKVEINLSYKSCYYENDNPEIIAKFTK